MPRNKKSAQYVTENDSPISDSAATAMTDTATAIMANHDDHIFLWRKLLEENSRGVSPPDAVIEQLGQQLGIDEPLTAFETDAEAVRRQTTNHRMLTSAKKRMADFIELHGDPAIISREIRDLEASLREMRQLVKQAAALNLVIARHGTEHSKAIHSSRRAYDRAGGHPKPSDYSPRYVAVKPA